MTYSIAAENGFVDLMPRPKAKAHRVAIQYALAVPGVRVNVINHRGELERGYLVDNGPSEKYRTEAS